MISISILILILIVVNFLIVKVSSADWKFYTVYHNSYTKCMNLTTDCAYYDSYYATDRGAKQFSFNVGNVWKADYPNVTECLTNKVGAQYYGDFIHIGCNFTCNYYYNEFRDSSCGKLKFYHCTASAVAGCTTDYSITTTRIEEPVPSGDDDDDDDDDKSSSIRQNAVNMFLIMLIIIMQFFF